MKYTCTQYREEMMLLSLQRQLNRKDLTESERKEIEEKIRELKAQMDMD